MMRRWVLELRLSLGRELPLLLIALHCDDESESNSPRLLVVLP